MKRLLFLVACVFAVLASSAQDLIIKKDGSTVKALVKKVTSTEVEYKKASNPKGPSYSIAIADLFAINYANGEKDLFNTPAEPQSKPENKTNQTEVSQGAAVADSPVSQSQEYITDETASQYSRDNELVKMYNNGVDVDLLRKASTYKKVGLWVGIPATLAGATWLILGVTGVVDADGYAGGGALGAVGIATMSYCFIKSHQYKKKAYDLLGFSPVWTHDIQLGDRCSLALECDVINNVADYRDKGLGVGLKLNF